MKTYKEHYEYCRKVNPVMGNDYYKNVYDLTVDANLLWIRKAILNKTIISA